MDDDEYTEEFDAYLTAPGDHIKRNYELDPDYLEHGNGAPTEGRRKKWDLSEWLDDQREGDVFEAGPNPLGHYMGVKGNDGRMHSTFVPYTREEYEEVF